MYLYTAVLAQLKSQSLILDHIVPSVFTSLSPPIYLRVNAESYNLTLC